MIPMQKYSSGTVRQQNPSQPTPQPSGIPASTAVKGQVQISPTLQGLSWNKAPLTAEQAQALVAKGRIIVANRLRLMLERNKMTETDVAQVAEATARALVLDMQERRRSILSMCTGTMGNDGPDGQLFFLPSFDFSSDGKLALEEALRSEYRKFRSIVQSRS
jgi:hypothetical protein